MFRPRLLITAILALTSFGTGAIADPSSPKEREQWFTISIPEIQIPQINVSIAGRTIGPQLQPWMNPEIADAWRQGFQGQGTVITVIDDFNSGSRMAGDLGFGPQLRTHGDWTRQQVTLMAPRATVQGQDFTNNRAVSLTRNRLNVLNLSYGVFAEDGYRDNQIGWGAREASIINFARGGNAVVVKAAGNDQVAIGSGTAFGDKDYLASALSIREWGRVHRILDDR